MAAGEPWALSTPPSDGDTVAQGLSLEQSLRDLLSDAVRTDDSLRHELARLRATTSAPGRHLDVATLIREGRSER